MNTETDTIQAPVREWQRPLYDVSENEDVFKVRVSLPGVSRDAVNISVEEEILTIEGTRVSNVPEGWRPLRREGLPSESTPKCEAE